MWELMIIPCYAKNTATSPERPKYLELFLPEAQRNGGPRHLRQFGAFSRTSSTISAALTLGTEVSPILSETNGCSDGLDSAVPFLRSSFPLYFFKTVTGPAQDLPAGHPGRRASHDDLIGTQGIMFFWP